MRPDIVLVICDTARADAFAPWHPRRNTPWIRSLCSDGVWFAAAAAAAPWTLPSTASILSGLLPTEHGISGEALAWNGGEPTSPAPAVRGLAGRWLPEALQQLGYRTWAASANAWLSRWGGFDRGFERFMDVRPSGPDGGRGRAAKIKLSRLLGRMDRGGRRIVADLRACLAGEDRRPLFALINLMETHTPYDPPAPFFPHPAWRRPATRRLSAGDASRRFLRYNTGGEAPPAGLATDLRTLYLAAARYEDALLGRIRRDVEARDRPTLVVVTSDHGENLGEHGLFVHNSSLHQTLLHVPLVFWGRGIDLRGEPVREPVSLLGLADAILSFAGDSPELPRPDAAVRSEYESTARQRPLDGIDGGTLRPAAGPALVDQRGLAVRSKDLTYLTSQDGSESLYDLASDPEQERDLAPAAGARLAPFRAERAAWLGRLAASGAPKPPAGSQPADAEVAEHLRALGYID